MSLLVRSSGAGPDADADAIGRIYFKQVSFEEELDQIAVMQQTRQPRYREMLRRFGFNDEIGMIFDDNGLWGGMEVSREQGAPRFTESNREEETARRRDGQTARTNVRQQPTANSQQPIAVESETTHDERGAS